jgi:hypothetical protein
MLRKKNLIFRISQAEIIYDTTDINNNKNYEKLLKNKFFLSNIKKAFQIEKPLCLNLDLQIFEING